MKKTPAPFRFKHFLLHQAHDVMKVSTDSILLGSWVNPVGAKNILDIGTGTGILALLMAQKSTAEIDAIDISESACSLARKNFLESPWSNRLKVYETSVQNFRPEKKYDLIISNPPYFQNSLKSPYASRNSFRHDSGMSISDLLKGVSKLLSADGTACFALSFGNTSSLANLFLQYNLIPCSELLVKSDNNSIPYLHIFSVSKSPKTFFSNQEIVIYKNNQQYSDDYIQITFDIYFKDMKASV